MKRTLLITCLLTLNIMWSQMTVTSNSDAEDLILNGLVGNPNFPATNAISSSGENFGDVNGLGIFTYTGSDFNLTQGLILSTGDVTMATGPNTSILSQGSSSWQGDADLDALLTISSQNATLLEFDFFADVDAVSLDFLMASEEYVDAFQCNFSDSFAFILTNLSTGVSINFALVPGTTTPIAVTTVHDDQGGSCPAINESYFDRYNYLPYNPEESSVINFNGQTEVFTLVGALEAGNNYSIKIVIADASDTLYDSALFVRNSSFGAFPIIDQEPDNLIVEDSNEDGFETFDLTSNESLMLGAVDTNTYSFLFTYHLSQEDANAGINAISNPESYTNDADLQDIYVSMRNAFTGTNVVTSFKITINADLLSVDGLEDDTITMYPNPVSDQLIIENKQSNIKNVAIYGTNGQLISSQSTTNNNRIEVDFSALSRGMYWVKVSSENGIIHKKIIK